MNRTPIVPAIDHLGWAVRSIDSARPHFEEGLGLGFQSDERFPEVRTAFFGAGPTRIELLEPLTPESEVGRFISRRGEGLHHLALRVDDVAAALAEADEIDRELRMRRRLTRDLEAPRGEAELAFEARTLELIEVEIVELVLEHQTEDDRYYDQECQAHVELLEAGES